MAPSSVDKDVIYKFWAIQELKTECTKRKLEFSDTDTIDNLVDILVKDDNKPPDWGKIYARVLYHTGMNYEEIARRTIPQIMAILDGAEENISIKMGLPNMFGGSNVQGNSTNDEASQEDVEAFFNSF